MEERPARPPDHDYVALAVWCRDHASHLREQIKAILYAGLSDRALHDLVFHHPEDPRIQALNILASIPVARPAPPPPPRYYDYPAPPPKKTEKVRRLGDLLSNFSAAFTVVPAVAPEIRVDTELGRACIQLNKAALYRLYVIARELTRAESGSGKVSRQQLKAALKAYQIAYTRRHINRLLAQGEGLFWRARQHHLYLLNPARVAVQLAMLEPAIFATNRPGSRDMLLSPVGALEQWEAMLYAGWLAHRSDPTISRAALEGLFWRNQDTLRRWEQQRLDHIITIQANYCQCPNSERFFEEIPVHRLEYVAAVRFKGHVEKEVRLYWRMPNSYHTRTIREYPHKGQARKVREAVNDTLDEPADEKRGGGSTRRRYFENPRHLRKHVEKHGKPGYLWMGVNRYGRRLWEINRDGFLYTHVNERLAPAAEEELMGPRQVSRYLDSWEWA
ncbi:MAG: hypothetical protein K8L99_26970 [Anaerolineae bacterium]|nr:hypothetical protein [Anaerolineae bacterium]